VLRVYSFLSFVVTDTESFADNIAFLLLDGHAYAFAHGHAFQYTLSPQPCYKR
jgi:hypothetical protein